MLAVSLLIPAIMILFGSIFEKHAPKEINDIVGYRTTMSMKNQDTWEFAHHHFGRIWRIAGLMILLPTVIVMILLYDKSEDILSNAILVIITIQTILLIISIIPTEVALRKNFDEDGNRKQ